MQVQLTGGFFPQTRPEAADQAISAGVSGTLRIAPASWLTIQGRYWAADAAYNEGLSQGISTSAIIRLDSDTSGVRWSVVPTFGLTTNKDFTLEGKGASLILAAWLPASELFQPYVGVGPAYGWSPTNYNSTTATTNADGMNDQRNGWAAILNIGTHCTLVDNLSVVGELSTVCQVNLYDGRAHIIFSPIIGVAYAF